MAVSKAQQKAVHKYVKSNYDRQELTMPKGNYKALRVEIGEAKGHNWWCVMYPPLCIPAACEVETDEDTVECFFDEKEQDILEKPKKYKVRSAIWDELKKLIEDFAD